MSLRTLSPKDAELEFRIASKRLERDSYFGGPAFFNNHPEFELRLCEFNLKGDPNGEHTRFFKFAVWSTEQEDWVTHYQNGEWLCGGKTKKGESLSAKPVIFKVLSRGGLFPDHQNNAYGSWREEKFRNEHDNSMTAAKMTYTLSCPDNGPFSASFDYLYDHCFGEVYDGFLAEELLDQNVQGTDALTSKDAKGKKVSVPVETPEQMRKAMEKSRSKPKGPLASPPSMWVRKADGDEPPPPPTKQFKCNASLVPYDFNLKTEEANEINERRSKDPEMDPEGKLGELIEHNKKGVDKWPRVFKPPNLKFIDAETEEAKALPPAMYKNASYVIGEWSIKFPALEVVYSVDPEEPEEGPKITSAKMNNPSIESALIFGVSERAGSKEDHGADDAARQMAEERRRIRAEMEAEERQNRAAMEEDEDDEDDGALADALDKAEDEQSPKRQRKD